MTGSDLPVRVVVADDHPVVREGLRHVLATQPDLLVVGVAANGREAVDLIRAHRPHVALLDLQMPVLDGVGTLRELGGEPTGTAVLVLTTYDSDADWRRRSPAGSWASDGEVSPTGSPHASSRCSRWLPRGTATGRSPGRCTSARRR